MRLAVTDGIANNKKIPSVWERQGASGDLFEELAADQPAAYLAGAGAIHEQGLTRHIRSRTADRFTCPINITRQQTSNRIERSGAREDSMHTVESRRYRLPPFHS